MTIEELFAELAEQMETNTNAILAEKHRKADEIVTDTLEQLDLRAVMQQQVEIVKMIEKAA